MLLAALPALASARAPSATSADAMVEVVAELEAPSAAQVPLPGSRGRLDLGSRALLRRLTRIRVEQELVAGRIADAVPEARIRWRYRVVLNALAVVLPARSIPALERVEGVAAVNRGAVYHAQLDRSPAAIGAPALWGPGLSTAGQGIKVAIIDDGIDQRHPFFDPAGYAMPPGFPKGQTAYTTAKVIVGRAFPPPSPLARYANLPLNPAQSEHGTHVAGIVAGNNGTPVGGRRLSGVAPKAYLGNYRVLTLPTAANVGLDGNSPEIAAAIEAAVQDGMDVINLSIGEPEIAPGRDLVVRAIEGAARAGVVTTISAGNDFDFFGRGSVSSPGSAPSAITVAATTLGRAIAGFSSAGPTPLSLRLKPELSAPGVDILSAAPARLGQWQELSGTSMAAPHVAGAAALLLQRHPSWTPAQVKSALVSTGRPAFLRSREAPTSREGGGFVDLPRADQPLIFATPSAVSFGFVPRGATAGRRISLADAGGGAGEWTATVAPQASTGVRFRIPPRVTVPGAFQVAVSAPRAARGAEFTGFVVLRRGAETRRIPFWGRVTAPPRLARLPARRLVRTGTYRGNTRGRPALVSLYRYPENPTESGVDRILRGPEQLFRVRLHRPAENFGVAIVSRGRGVRVQPRIVLGKDENRLAGQTALPLNTNPYLPTLYERTPIVSVIRPPTGTYHVVFDSTTRAGAGRFAFRFWIDDRRPPNVRLVTRSVRSRGELTFRAVDTGAGIDPGSIFASVDGRNRIPTYSPSGDRMTISVPVGRLPARRHRVVFQVSDRQEAKNMENALRVLPNTRVLDTTFVVR